MNSRNIDILERMIRYCKEIEEAQVRFGNTLESLQTDALYKNAVAMCILQIGELTANLTDDFKSTYAEVPWQKIKGMRNIAAHHYSKFDAELMFKTMTERIPELLDYCEKIASQYTLLEQETENISE